ncbi:hypothetical protein RCL_jg1024.t1 [Rhizophagus clarus]|uniref:Uncharacterized protein n=1 Tax=Rhizophagus clarus TaxID=94130 RepID=A0A8H3M4L3_9GLOM|nr:hypothetical protein RCL_jg1024.t1 [Rhizophagus clarus]
METIRNVHWKNALDPRLCREQLNRQEKNFTDDKKRYGDRKVRKMRSPNLLRAVGGWVASLLGRTGLEKCCRPSWTNQTWECCRPSWTNRTWEYCWTPDLKCCSFPCSS